MGLTQLGVTISGVRGCISILGARQQIRNSYLSLKVYLSPDSWYQLSKKMKPSTDTGVEVPQQEGRKSSAALQTL